MKLVLRLIFLLFIGIGFAGCAKLTVLYQDKDHVSVYLVGEPEVNQSDYRIRFVFETPTDDPHLVQRLNLPGWSAQEAFRPLYFADETTIDSHWVEGPVREDWRRLDIRPGKVSGTDETCYGFSMLPGAWPNTFNEKYRSNHAVQGQVEYVRDEYATVYLIKFSNGVLVWEVEGTDIRYEWKAEKVVD